MNKDKFLRGIDRVSVDLWEDFKEIGELNLSTYLCLSLERRLGNDARVFFRDQFKGGRDSEDTGMFGTSRKFINQEVRFQALCLFEHWCLDTKEYLKW